jgi:hypothetical protein
MAIAPVIGMAAETPDRTSFEGADASVLRRLLAEVVPAARLEEVSPGPVAHLTLRVRLGGRTERRVIVAEQLVQSASRGVTAAIGALRGALATQLGRPVSGAPVAGSARYRALARGNVHCAVCQKPIRMTDYVVRRRAQVLHSRCATAAESKE